MRTIITTILVLLPGVLAGPVQAQAPAAGGAAGAQPSDAATGTALGPYTVSGSAELGQRFLSLDGSDAKYRSDFNEEPGFRLFNADLTMRAKPGDTDTAVDSLRLSAFGWGGDPSQVVRGEVEKTRWYRLEANVRRLRYYNNLQNVALNLHTADTTRTFGDATLTMFPANARLRPFVGYSFDSDHGTATTTYEFSRDVFQLQAPTQSSANDFRAGFDATLGPVNVSFLQGYRQFHDNTTYLVPQAQAGLSTTDQATLTLLNEVVPTRGHTPFTRVSVHARGGSAFDITGRFIYSHAQTEVDAAENARGQDFQGRPVIADLLTAQADARRPDRVGDVGLTWFATDRLSVSDTVRIDDFDITGSSGLTESLLTGTAGGGAITPATTTSFLTPLIQYRQYLNTIEAHYQIAPRLGVYGGYRYGNRRIGVSPDSGALDVTHNNTNVALAGATARPLPPWRLYVDLEKGTANNVFTRISNYDVTNVRLRNTVQATDTLSLNLSFVSRDNNNPAQTLEVPPREFGASVNTRIATTSADWAPSPRATLSAGYTYFHVDSNASILFFLDRVEREGTSLYFMHTHSVFAQARLQVHPRVGVTLGYRLDKDTDTNPAEDPSASPTTLVSAYPLTLQSPEASVRVMLVPGLWWTTGYRNDRYTDQLFASQTYRAHVAYTTLTVGTPGRSQQ